MSIITQNTKLAQPNTWVSVSDMAPEGGMTVNINVVNKNKISSARVDICIITGSEGNVDEGYIEEYSLVARGTPLLRTGEPLKQGERVYVRSDTSDVNVRVSGFNKL